MSDFRAWRVDEKNDGSFVGSEQTCSTDSLPLVGDNNESEESVLIKVTHSSLNYKDAMSASGNKGVTRSFPHTPGIDAAGTLLGKDGSVLVTGYDLGMTIDGGFGECIRVPSKWIVAPNPFAVGEESSAKSACRLSMIYGTAGLTAALCVSKLIEVGGAKPDDGRVVVTGASGGVGSISVELLAKLGFSVVAISGKADDPSSKNRLMELGATEILGRDALEANPRPLLRPDYAHAIDTVGGKPLAEILKKIAPGGSVAACGNAAGLKVDTSVLPFILRGVQLLGVDSVEISLEEKHRMWIKLATDWRCPVTETSVREIGRHEIDGCLKAMLRGESTGKILLDHSLTKDNGCEGVARAKL